jgi:hypothetical protein
VSRSHARVEPDAKGGVGVTLVDGAPRDGGRVKQRVRIFSVRFVESVLHLVSKLMNDRWEPPVAECVQGLVREVAEGYCT